MSISQGWSRSFVEPFSRRWRELIWNLVSHHFPEAIQMVARSHATEHITPVAQAAFDQEGQAKRWERRVRDR